MFENCATISPTSGQVSKLIVLLHGIGSNGRALLNLAPAFNFLEAFPNIAIVAPNGIETYRKQAGRYQWFNVDTFNLKKFQERLKKNGERIWQNIKIQLDLMHLTTKDLILIGFSQGAMVSLHLALEATEPLNCVIGFSGALIPPTTLQPIPVPTPVCLIHGQEDDVLGINYMNDAALFLTQQQFIVETYTIPNLKHTIDQRGIIYALDFIKRHNQ